MWIPMWILWITPRHCIPLAELQNINNFTQSKFNYARLCPKKRAQIGTNLDWSNKTDKKVPVSAIHVIFHFSQLWLLYTRQTRSVCEQMYIKQCKVLQTHFVRAQRERNWLIPCSVELCPRLSYNLSYNDLQVAGKASIKHQIFQRC